MASNHAIRTRRINAPPNQAESLKGARAAVRPDRSPIPLYHRLYVVLRERIVNGTYRVGQTLPTEAELIERFGVSRITVSRGIGRVRPGARPPR
jgi:Bacterial regulatory proteins, gntR family